MPTQIALDCSAPTPFSNLDPFVFGTAMNPAGVALTADGVSFMEDGRRLIPVMGEIHYTRYPQAEWRDALLKMKAGGITVVATYVFWIHHEERRGEYRWDGDRDLAAFVRTIHDAGLRCVVRVGPWCHGEVRNGGLPEWLFDRGIKVREDDSTYLGEVRRWYAAIAEQLQGTLWKEGGPVIGVQIENEYPGPAGHLLTLREIAIEAGLDVPYYTRTGWPELQTPMEFGKLLPLYGGYAEGFWDRDLSTMPGAYWKEFVFKTVRTDAAIANEQFGTREAKDEPGTNRYPYLTCELGAGMMCSYHRRINVFPKDPLSMCVTKLGSGSNLPGYYMYHGGTNPAGHVPWLNEHQATKFTNYNDLPVKTYDFQTAVGEFGQIREQYHLLRPIHLFLQDFGEQLAPLATVLPEQAVTKTDDQTLRYAVRTDGRRGFVFVNNYHRLLPMPERPDIQFRLTLADGELTFPNNPTTLPADSSFFWPLNFDLGDGATLDYATAQPVCQFIDNDIRYTVLAGTGGPIELSINGLVHANLHPDAGEPMVIATRPVDRMHKIVLLHPADAKRFYKLHFAGQDRAVLCDGGLFVDAGKLRTIDATQLAFIGSAPALALNGQPLTGVKTGVITRFDLPKPPTTGVTAKVHPMRVAGELRTIRLGAAGVAAQPTDAEFAAAAEWRIEFSGDLAPGRKHIARITYAGDVARAYAGDTLVTDNFYNGTPFDIGLWRDNGVLLKTGLTLRILPLQQNAPIYMLDETRPAFIDKPSVARLLNVTLYESVELTLTASA